MKCQNLLSGKNKKNILKCCLLKFLPSMQSANRYDVQCKKRTIPDLPVHAQSDQGSLFLLIQYILQYKPGREKCHQTVKSV